MNVPSPAPEAALLASASYQASSVLFDAAHAQNASALWKETFEHMRDTPLSVAGLPMSMHDINSTAPSLAHDPNSASNSDEQRPLNTASLQPAAAESVNVFVHGAAVAIVIRAAALSSHEALHCAFETARELTGRRAALQHLQLNGNTIYRHSDSGALEAVRGPGHPPATLVFAC